MLITYIKRSNCGRQWIILHPVLDSHIIKIIERFEKIVLIREMLQGNKLYVSCKVAIKNMAYINKISINKFSWFLHFVQQQQRLLSCSLDFDFLSRIVCDKNTWKSSTTAKREFLKVNFRFLQESAKGYLCQKQKT